MEKDDPSAWEMEAGSPAPPSSLQLQWKKYWMSRTPLERLQALEMMRQIVYGYDPATTRMQRVLEIVELGEDGTEKRLFFRDLERPQDSV